MFHVKHLYSAKRSPLSVKQSQSLIVVDKIFMLALEYILVAYDLIKFSASFIY